MAIPTLGAGAIPATQAEFEEALSDASKVSAMVAAGTFGPFVKAYVERSKKTDPTILAQVKEETERAMTAWLREHGESDQIKRLNLTPGAGMRVGREGQYRHDAVGAALDSEFESTSDFLRFAWDRATDPETSGRRARIRAEYSSISPTDGGFLVPERLRAELLRVALETAIVRPRARVIPMDSARVPFPMIDSTSNADSIHGGIIGYWTAEKAALVESSARFGRVVLDAKKLTARADVPAELLQDSIISLAAFIEDAFPEAIGWFEDVAFMSGTGVGEPTGALTALNTAMITQAKEVGQLADTIVYENLTRMYSRMLPTSLARAVWLAPPSAFHELATMALNVGTGGGPVGISANGITGAPALSIFGRPVVLTEKAPKIGDAMDLSFVDWAYYLIGDRAQMRVESSTHFKFDSDETSYRVIERVDGVPWLKNAITPKNGGDTLSPFVSLAERA
jgi:HK97 family phage major capsid protein